MATIITITGTLAPVVCSTADHLNSGFSVLSEWSHIDWPHFWRRKYYVMMYQAGEGEKIEVSSNNRIFLSRVNNEPLKSQLQQAIESENYEEAARLRDLMNKA